MPNFHLALLLCCAAFLSACQQPTAPATSSFDDLSLTVGDPQTVAESEATNRRVRELLKKRLTMEIEGTKLVHLMDALEKEIGVPIHVKWAQFEAAGIEKDIPMYSRAIKNVTAEQAIRIFLDMTEEAAGQEPTGFVVRDGILILSTLRDLQKTTTTRIHDIRDLIEPVPTVPRSLGFDEFDMTIWLKFPGRDARATTLFDDEDYDSSETREERSERIITLLQDFVGQQADWAAYGGEIGSLREFDGDLILKATPEHHEEIERLLSALRIMRAKAKIRHDVQMESLKKANVPELIEQLRRMEKKFDDFNWEYGKKLEAERKAKENP